MSTSPVIQQLFDVLYVVDGKKHSNSFGLLGVNLTEEQIGNRRVNFHYLRDGLVQHHVKMLKALKFIGKRRIRTNTDEYFFQWDIQS